ncbi:MAG: arylsulfatase A-like enzyme [Myxococcota bacterium]|jgi:arylsulfatase A-like enzyme
MRFVVLFAVLACRPDPVHDTHPVVTTGSTPTESFPVFEGSVPRNVLMISIDTLRKDHLSRYDLAQRELTPFLDGLMNTGFVLDDHLTCSNWTFPGITCTLLGRNHTEVGFMPQLEPASERIEWPAGQAFLSDALRDAGFATVLSSANGYLSRDWGTADGYDATSGVAFDPADSIYAEGIANLEAARDSGAERWFLHLHFLEPHAPYLQHDGYTPSTSDLVPVPWDLEVKTQHYDATREWPEMSAPDRANLTAHLTRRYQGEVAFLDASLSGMFADLGARGLLDDTLVVVWNDHGESFWEHGNQSHAWTLHRPENDGLAFFWAPNIVPGAWDGPTHATDLMPTLLELLALPIPEGVTGIPLGLAPPGRARFANTVARAGVQQSVQIGKNKLLYEWTGSAAVYDLSFDPAEMLGHWDPSNPTHLELWSALVPEVRALQPLVNGFPGPTAPSGVEL